MGFFKQLQLRERSQFVSDQELRNKILLIRIAIINDETFDEAELKSLTNELLWREAQSKFDELTQGFANDFGSARLGFDEPIRELLARDRFPHFVRWRCNVVKCLAGRRQFAAKSH